MLNKKYLFGGGLYLVNTAIVAISTSSVATAEGSHTKIRNALNQIYWRIKANNIIYYTLDKDKNAWIKKKKYWDSIVKVIGKAIGDCVTRDNEFKDKQLSDIITFTATPEGYKPENWNAVVLYNLVEYTKRNVRYECCLEDNTLYAEPKKLENYKTISFDQIEDDLTKYYTNYYKINGYSDLIGKLKDDIKKAINDIKQYDNALGLTKILRQTMQTAYTYDLPKTPAGMIKTFKSYCQRAEECLQYGEQVISQANSELNELIVLYNKKYNEHMAKLPSGVKFEDAEKSFRRDAIHLKYLSDRYSRLQSQLKNKATDECITPYRTRLEKYKKLLSKDDEFLYKNNLIDKTKIDATEKLLTEILKNVSTLNNILTDSLNARLIPRIHEEYKEHRNVTNVEPQKPDFHRPSDLKKLRNIYLAPELRHTKKADDWKFYNNDYKYLHFKDALDSQFWKHPEYTQHSIPDFECDDDESSILDMDKITVLAPVQEVVKGNPSAKNKLNVTQLFFHKEYDGVAGIKKGAQYALSKNLHMYFIFNNSNSITCRVTTDDPMCGDAMKLLDDLIRHKKRRDLSELIRQGKLKICHKKIDKKNWKNREHESSE